MKLLITILSFSLLFCSCAKENSDYFVTYQNNPLNDTAWSDQISADAAVNTIPQVLQPIPTVGYFTNAYNFLVNLSADVSFAVSAGSSYLNGSPADGNLNVIITSIKSKGDFVRAGISTVTNGKYFESAAAFLVQAEKNGEPLTVKPGSFYQVYYKYPNPVNGLSLLYGTESSPQTPSLKPALTWNRALDSSTVFSFSRQDTTGITTGYQINARNYGWISCGRIIDSSTAQTNLTTVLPPTFTNKNTVIYAVFKQRRTVVELKPQPGNKTFIAQGIPVNTPVTIVSISAIGDQLYLGSKELTVSPDEVIKFNPAPKIKGEINHFLDSL